MTDDGEGKDPRPIAGPSGDGCPAGMGSVSHDGRNDMSGVPHIVMSNGVSIPQLGLGVFRNPDGDTTVSAVREALAAGGDDFLTKPILPRHLIKAVLTRGRRVRQLQGAAQASSDGSAASNVRELNPHKRSSAAR